MFVLSGKCIERECLLRPNDIVCQDSDQQPFMSETRKEGNTHDVHEHFVRGYEELARAQNTKDVVLYMFGNASRLCALSTCVYLMVMGAGFWVRMRCGIGMSMRASALWVVIRTVVRLIVMRSAVRLSLIRAIVRLISMRAVIGLFLMRYAMTGYFGIERLRSMSMQCNAFV